MSILKDIISRLEQRDHPPRQLQRNPPRKFRHRAPSHDILNDAVIITTHDNQQSKKHHSPSEYCDETIETTSSSKRGGISGGTSRVPSSDGNASDGNRDGEVVNTATWCSLLRIGLRTHAPRSPLVPRSHTDIPRSSSAASKPRKLADKEGTGAVCTRAWYWYIPRHWSLASAKRA